MPQPLVSVVVPVLNVAGLLPRCLDSLLAQTHRPLEIIVVNDGSTDDSGAVIERYAARHPEVRAVHQQHRGLGPPATQPSPWRTACRWRWRAQARSAVPDTRISTTACGRTASQAISARGTCSPSPLLAVLRAELHELGLWSAWYPSYRRLLRSSRVVVTIQVLLQRNRIPLRSRGVILARFAARLHALAEPRPEALPSPVGRAFGPSAIDSGRP